MAGTDRKISSMKKCSHTAHESLTELNITPLLDLAFVLLVIFIITTIPPVKDMDLKLPNATKHEKDPPRKAHYISVQADGLLFLDREDLKMEDLLGRILSLRDADPDIHVIVRGDAKTHYKQIRAVLDLCQQANLAKVELATEIAK
jgi:biopolymer transport protein ExbD